MPRGWVYITTNRKHGVLYIGTTSDLPDRIKKHKEKAYPNSFSARYNLDKLVRYEEHPSMAQAIEREKQLKAGPRRKKIELIDKMNPEWRDLYDDVVAKYKRV